ncbi:MAG: sensor histidine kinase [Candidatus Korobacteraceae bacterium]
MPRLAGVARAYLLAIAFWSGIALLMGVQYRPANQPLSWSWFLGLPAQAIVHAFPFALWTPPIFFLVSKYLIKINNRVRYVSAWALGAVPFVLLHTAIAWAVIRPPSDALPKLGSWSFQWWLEIISTSFADDVQVYIAIVVAAHAYEYLKRVRRQEAERYEYQQALAASELQALKMQLQPHFLFNTLHGIATLVDSEPETARAMILKLSNLLRTALERDGADLIALEDEIRFAREYLDLEKMRFGDRLRVDWQVAPETSRTLVPQMILQPLVENAIRHGIAPSRKGGWVEVATANSDGMLTLRVRNSADGKTSNGTGIGLRNVEARLKYLYSGEAHLALMFGEDRTVTVTLTLPALNSRPTGIPRHSVQSVVEGKDPLCAFLSSTTNL